MKIILLFFILPLLVKSQNVLPEKDGIVMYTDVIMVDSTVSKEELFNRAKMWFATTYNSANDVIQMQDKDAGILIGRGIFDVLYIPGFLSDPTELRVRHTIKLYFKKGKYKYEITDLSGHYYNTTGVDIKIENQIAGFEKKNYQKMLVSVNKEILATINSLEDAMTKPVTTEDF